jgi:hypothetical protein
VSGNPRAPPAGRVASDPVGRRPLPRTHRWALPETRSPGRDALREAVPFVFFGLLCVAIAVWLFEANPAPGNPLPIWTLLLGIGVVAIAGGIVAVFLPGEQEPTPRPNPPRPMAEPRRLRPRPTILPDEPVEPTSPSSALFAMPLRERTAPASAPPPEPFLRSRSAPAGAYDGWLGGERSATEAPPDAPDEVIASLTELSGLVRGPRSGATPAGGSVRLCSGCESPLPEGVPIDRCHECGGEVCGQCLDRAAAAGHAGLCPTCASLSEPLGRRAPRIRPASAD